jgi:hypothetical protein
MNSPASDPALRSRDGYSETLRSAYTGNELAITCIQPS